MKMIMNKKRRTYRGNNIEGEVTSINKDLLYFEVNRMQIYMICLFLENPNQKLPKTGTKVKINIRYNSLESNFVLLTSETEIEGFFSEEIWRENHRFLSLVRSVGLTYKDLRNVILNYKHLKQCFKAEFSSEEIICGVISVLEGIRQIKLVSQCLYLNSYEVDVYKKYTYWTWGNHWIGGKNSKSDVLLGFICLHPANGHIMITDFKKSVPCLISKIPDEGCSEFIGKFVIVTECVYITEIYNSNSIIFSEYIIVDFQEIKILELPYKDNLKSGIKQGCQEDCFKLISKSGPIAGINNKIDLWLEVDYINKNKEFLCLDASSTSFALLLENSVYKIIHHLKPRNAQYRYMQMVNANLLQRIATGAVKLECCYKTAKLQLMDTIWANQQLRNSGPVSFQGKIKFKKFTKPLSSRTPRFSQNPMFGTPGHQTHLLEFDAGLTVYLNNWENSLIPFGLIPNMVVNVRNVVPQSGRYYKSTAMTSFEIVRYEPPVKFESASEFGWIRYFCLGAGRHLPDGVSVWGRIVSYFVLNLKILPMGETPDVSITLIALDKGGKSKVIARNKPGLLLLRLLLGMQEPIFKQWCLGFQSLGSVEYVQGQKIEGVFDCNNVKHMLQNHLDLIGRSGQRRLDLECRKIDVELPRTPVYFLQNAESFRRFA